jgi:hypothetical protein
VRVIASQQIRDEGSRLEEGVVVSVCMVSKSNTMQDDTLREGKEEGWCISILKDRSLVVAGRECITLSLLLSCYDSVNAEKRSVAFQVARQERVRYRDGITAVLSFLPRVV